MKKIIDGHGRLFGKISIIDLIVIVIVVALCAALFVKTNVLGAANGNADKGTITYTITIFGVRSFTVDALKKGDQLYDKNNSGGYTVGTIADIKKADATRASETNAGKIVMGKYEGRYDVTLTVTANGAQTDGRYLVNRTYELNTNSNRTFTTKYCTFDATITEIA